MHQDYKVIARVIKVGSPAPIGEASCHVAIPCRIYKVEDRMTFRAKPSKLILEETDAVCLEALSATLPPRWSTLQGDRGGGELPSEYKTLSVPRRREASSLRDQKSEA